MKRLTLAASPEVGLESPAGTSSPGLAGLFRNPRASRSWRTAAPPREPLDYHRTLLGYLPTPLRAAPELGLRLGLDSLRVKDEAHRFGLPAFKVLGALWALRGVKPAALVAATDGNHGRGVARVAATLGVPARIFVPRGTAGARIEAIRGEGAEVREVDGGYDRAVENAAAEAETSGAFLLQDHAWPGYEEVPARITEGYSTIFWEIEEQVAEEGAPPFDLVLFPVGVGALAAAGVRHYRREGIERPPALVSVEPYGEAACALASAEAGRRVATGAGAQASLMAGLNCGTPSSLAWPLLDAGIDLFVSVGDERAREAMRLLWQDGIVAGETGAAATAGLLELHARGALDGARHVLVLSTEGATDPGSWSRIVAGARTQDP